MTKDKKKKKKAKGVENDMAQEEGEGIALKMANEYRRTNRMELLTPEQFEARKAVIRGNNEKAEEWVKAKRVQTLSDQDTQSNTLNTSQRDRKHTKPNHTYHDTYQRGRKPSRSNHT